MRPLGLQVVAARADERQALVDFMHQVGAQSVIDIGANRGQFAQGLLDKGYTGRIYCIEPLGDAHEALAGTFREHGRVEVLERTAIGCEDGSITINIAGNSVSSSLRPMLDAHRKAAPSSAYIAEEQVSLSRLDTLLNGREEIAHNSLIKIDSQGFEAEVLAGAENALSLCRAVLIELSATPLYEGQALWDQIHNTLSGQGFVLWNLLPDFRDAKTGRLLQFDGLYLRE